MKNKKKTNFSDGIKRIGGNIYEVHQVGGKSIAVLA